MRVLAILVVILLLIVGGAFIAAGWMTGPAISIEHPEKFVGASTPLKVNVMSPGDIGSLDIGFEQDGARTSLFSLATAPAAPAQVARPDPGTVAVTHELNRQTLPAIKSGPARIVVTATRPVLFGLRTITAEHVRDVTVRLEPPRVGALSTHHYVNHGGTEMVVYRVSPEDVASGVKVGEIEYPGFPAAGAAGAGGAITDPARASR